ncbi:MAG: type III secretion system cytoplasmic ring protein SctQ [Candidatus Marsarchaeota archaeon]|nr:type III secretion system cytoplasmic ring protein SctQ [Candidatus Marsarchaeota archaeon]
MEPQNIINRLRHFSRELYALDQKPLLAHTFSFPWEAYAAALTKLFGCPITLTPQEVAWKEKTALAAGVCTPYSTMAIDLPGMTGSIHLLVSRADFLTLLSQSLKIDIEKIQQQDPAFIDQFILFATTHLLSSAQTLPPLQSLSPHLVSLAPPISIEEAGALCQDIVVTIGETRGLARAIIPAPFLESWKEARAAEAPPWAELSTTLSLEAGRSFLAPEEIASLHVGDFLAIQHPFYIPNSPKSRMYLTLQGKPLFRAKIKDETVQILEMPLEHEAFTPIGGLAMPAQSDPLPPAEEPLPLPETEEKNPFEGEEEEEPPAPPLTKEEVQATTISSRLAKEPLQLETLPLSISFQLAEISMTIAQISALQPGNLLDLQIRPENGVCLIVNNQVFATGDLVMIGDTVGVQIKEIGLK